MTIPARYRRNPGTNAQAGYRNMPWTRTAPGVCEAYQYSGNIQTPGWPEAWAVPVSYNSEGKLFIGAVVGRQSLLTGDWLLAVDARATRFLVAPKEEFLVAYILMSHGPNPNP